MGSRGLGFHRTHTFALMGRILICRSECLYICSLGGGGGGEGVIVVVVVVVVVGALDETLP